MMFLNINRKITLKAKVFQFNNLYLEVKPDDDFIKLTDITNKYDKNTNQCKNDSSKNHPRIKQPAANTVCLKEQEIKNKYENMK